MERTSAPYRHGLAPSRRRDARRRASAKDRAISDRNARRRSTARSRACRIGSRPARAGSSPLPIRAGLRLWEIVLLSAVIQWGMMPLLAQDFHRVSLAGPLSNIPAVILTGLIVPLGFLALLATFVWARLASLSSRRRLDSARACCSRSWSGSAACRTSPIAFRGRRLALVWYFSQRSLLSRWPLAPRRPGRANGSRGARLSAADCARSNGRAPPPSPR